VELSSIDHFVRLSVTELLFHLTIIHSKHLALLIAMMAADGAILAALGIVSGILGFLNCRINCFGRTFFLFGSCHFDSRNLLHRLS